MKQFRKMVEWLLVVSSVAFVFGVLPYLPKYLALRAELQAYKDWRNKYCAEKRFPYESAGIPFEFEPGSYCDPAEASK